MIHHLGLDADEFIVELADLLGDDADFADHRNKSGVAVPAGDDVLMKMAGKAGAGATAEVDAEVEALGGDGALQETDREDGLGLHVGEFVGIEQFEIGFVGAGGDEEMAVGVGEFVDADERVGRHPEEQVVLIRGGFALAGGAEETFFVRGLVEGTDVIHSPGGVKLVHGGMVTGKWGGAMEIGGAW